MVKRYVDCTIENQLMRVSMINYNVPLNSRHSNSNIKCISNPSELLNYGFRSTSAGRLYYSKKVSKDDSFNLSVSSDCDDIRIEVIDETLGQPYDYQRVLEYYPDNVYAKKVHKEVQLIMSELTKNGILAGYTANDYI